MTTPKSLPAVEYLRECFSYEPQTGELRWKTRPKRHFVTEIGLARANGKHAGRAAGSPDGNGYYEVGVDGNSYRLHRIIWKLVTGGEPPQTIDHVDGNRLNNAWTNLRVANDREQQWNVKTRVDNCSGYRGVSFSRGQWVARIKVQNVYRHLGYFPTPEQASFAYKEVARKFHGEFYRG